MSVFVPFRMWSGMDYFAEYFPLRIFPADSLAASVTTTVWIGVWVVAYFNLRLGWVASGLVVPGYLVPLLLVKPWAVFAIYLESAVTFWLVFALSESFHTKKPWSSFFGRDRFFALVLVSILVRAVFDAWLFPEFGQWVNATFEINFDYRNNLHSFGLIVVSLLANYYWKPGLFRGTLSMGLMVGISLLIVRYGLMEFTNFSLGNLQYMYEDIASSLLASPKAYIILVVSAFIASWMNLYYGWDFNGILIPSLLALQWNDPYKLFVSFVEATIVLVVSSGIMKLPMMKKTTMEGTRKILLFFNVMFCYRLAVGHVMAVWFPETPASDIFGFGFLLSTLLAIKAHQKGMLLRLIRATTQISLVGTIAGSAVGFALILLSALPWFSMADSRDSASIESELQASDQEMPSLEACIASHKVKLFEQYLPNSYTPPTASECTDFASGLRQLIHARNETNLESARRNLARANFALSQQADNVWMISEIVPRGQGIYFLQANREKSATEPLGLTIEVPAPLEEPLTMESALALFENTNASALGIAGTRVSAINGADVFQSDQTIFYTFHRVCGHNTLQIRALSNSGLLAKDATDFRNTLWVQRAIPDGFDLQNLAKIAGPLDIKWDVPSLHNIHRVRSNGPFLELGLSHQSRINLLRRLKTTDNRNTPGLSQSLHAYLRHRKQEILPEETQAYAAPRPGELLVYDRDVVSPLLNLINEKGFSAGAPDDRQTQTLTAVSFAATQLGCRVSFLPDDSGNQFVAIEEVEGRGWGTMILRVAGTGKRIISVPRPLLEKHVWDYSVNLFDVVNADAIILAGAHPRTNADGAADLLVTENQASIFNLSQQILLRHWKGDGQLLMHVRSVHDLNADLVMAVRNGAKRSIDMEPDVRQLHEELQQSGVSIRVVDGSAETAGHELAGAFGALAATQSDAKQLLNIWIGRAFRRRYRSQADNVQQQAQFDLLGIPSITTDLSQQLNHARGIDVTAGSLRTFVESWLRTQNVVQLRNLQLAAPHIKWQRIISGRYQQSFLVGWNGQRLVPFVSRLIDSPREEFEQQETQIPTGESSVRAEDVAAFERGQSSFLIFTKEQP